MTSRTAAVRHVARFGPLMLIAALAALIWRSNAELIIAAATAAIVLSMLIDLLFEAWKAQTHSALRRSSRVGAKRAFTPSARRRQARHRAYEPHAAMYRALTMSRSSQFDTVVYLRPIVQRWLETHPEARNGPAVQTLLRMPEVRSASRTDGGLDDHDFAALLAEFSNRKSV